MAGNITFTMIKPGAVANGYIGDILKKISDAGFWIAAMKITRLSIRQASHFYAVHQGKPFYEGLINFMTSGPIVVAILEKENAVEAYRAFIGNTDPSKAAPGTIRQLFGETVQRNAVHGSDCDVTAREEADFFFATGERFDRQGNVLEHEF